LKTLVSSAWLLGFVCVMLGCGSKPPPGTKEPTTPAAATTADKAPAAKPDATATAETKPEAKPDPVAKRAEQAAKAIAVLREEESPSFAGKMATNELAEPVYELPADLRKGLAAFTSPDIDPSQYGRILVAYIDEDPVKSVLERKCGLKTKDLLALDAKKAAGVKKILASCKVGEEALNGRKPEQVRPNALLLSLAVLELLEQRGAPSADEKAIARFLVQYDPDAR